MNKYLRITLGAVFVIVIVGTFIFYSMAGGWFAQHRGAGDVLDTRLPPQIIAQKKAAQKNIRRATRSTSKKQILFGDFHVHTTFSFDAFLVSLPMLQGRGAHPPADACDFARFCSNLDFWSINDHAEGISPANWEDTKRSIRQCDEVAGDENNKDLVSFLGWEWTQAGPTPKNHYGHKNVIMRDVEEDKTPTRPISSSPPEDINALGLRDFISGASKTSNFLLALAAPGGQRSDYLEFNRFSQEIIDVDDCPKGVHVRELPKNCFESTQTPKNSSPNLTNGTCPPSSSRTAQHGASIRRLAVPMTSSSSLKTPNGKRSLRSSLDTATPNNISTSAQHVLTLKAERAVPNRIIITCPLAGRLARSSPSAAALKASSKAPAINAPHAQDKIISKMASPDFSPSQARTQMIGSIQASAEIASCPRSIIVPAARRNISSL